MQDIFPFLIFYSIIIFQRLMELFIAKINEKWMKKQGALEFGSSHYKIMVLMHSLFLFSFLFEKIFFNRGVSSLWPLLLLTFLFTQAIRIWLIKTLGKYWNTKIIVLPNANVIQKGPYRYIKHPNYFVVTIEIIIIPLLFQAYFTVCLFTILNLIILSIRIPAEEKALKEFTEYEASFLNCNRFIPKMLNKCDN